MLITLVFLLTALPANAEGWRASPRCDPAATTPEVVVNLGGLWEHGVVPPFRVAARNRLNLGAQGCLRLPPWLQLSLAWDWLRDENGLGEVTMGPGDFRLGNAVYAWRRHGAWVGVGWLVKLPNARDEGELGTDETDVTIGFHGGWAGGPWAVSAGLGLSIQGNPLQFANQDDVVLVEGEGLWVHDWVALDATVSAALQSDRNPARIFVGVGTTLGRRWFLRPHGRIGLTPAAADGSAGLELGYRTGTMRPSTSL